MKTHNAGTAFFTYSFYCVECIMDGAIASIPHYDNERNFESDICSDTSEPTTSVCKKIGPNLCKPLELCFLFLADAEIFDIKLMPWTIKPLS